MYLVCMHDHPTTFSHITTRLVSFLIQKPPVLYHFCYNGKSPKPPLPRGYRVIFVFLLLLSIIQVPRGGIQTTSFYPDPCLTLGFSSTSAKRMQNAIGFFPFGSASRSQSNLHQSCVWLVFGAARSSVWRAGTNRTRNPIPVSRSIFRAFFSRPGRSSE
jgi:hypothetical protein